MNYFDDVEKQAELKRILDEWIGTPFRHHCGVKGKGCDCIHFVAGVFMEMGLVNVTKKDIPDYPRDWHLHNTREALMEAVIKHANVIEVELTSPMNGDIILSHYGQASSHAAIYFDGYIYQSVDGIGVCKIKFNDPVFAKQMKYNFRIQA